MIKLKNKSYYNNHFIYTRFFVNQSIILNKTISQYWLYWFIAIYYSILNEWFFKIFSRMEHILLLLLCCSIDCRIIEDKLVHYYFFLLKCIYLCTHFIHNNIPMIYRSYYNYTVYIYRYIQLLQLLFLNFIF